MSSMKNWNETNVSFAKSKGGVLVLRDPFDNLVKGGVAPWPPPEIVQKLYRSRQERAFTDKHLKAVRDALGYYCDLQSMHSEDAITWSVFGTIKYSSQENRQRFVSDLLSLTKCEANIRSHVAIWLWRRVPHPDTLVPGGPEVDFGIITDRLVILGEAKWLSSVGKGQGKAKDKDQITLRAEFAQKWGKNTFGADKQFIILGVSQREDFVENRTLHAANPTVLLRGVTWEKICGICSHPLSAELVKYHKWKRKNSLQKRGATGEAPGSAT